MAQNITKQALANSMKKLAAKKGFDKVTVTDIVGDCGVQRQTFYYHFQDIFELLEWTFKTELTKVVSDNYTYDTWQNGFLGTMRYLEDNRNIIYNLIHSDKRRYMENFFNSLAYDLMRGVVKELSGDIIIDLRDKEFILTFYRIVFMGIFMEWIDHDMEDTPEAVLERLEKMISGSIYRSLLQFEKT